MDARTFGCRLGGCVNAPDDAMTDESVTNWPSVGNSPHSAADHYRIEADCAMRDYDALEVDAGLMARALKAIAEARPNKQFDPWARGVANDALWNVSERTKGLL